LLTDHVAVDTGSFLEREGRASCCLSESAGWVDSPQGCDADLERTSANRPGLEGLPALLDYHYGAIVKGMPKDSLAEVTAIPELGSTTESEQMYLITVARAIEGGALGPVPISRIASELGVSVPSANEMVRKLDSRGLLLYEPYRGVLLSHVGQQVADQVLRTRRLWATFLADHLGFSPADADDQACHLEHATTPEAADRLAAFLGNPEAGPLGKPIPQTTIAEHRQPTVRLTDLPVGETAEVISIAATDRAGEFLAAEGVVVGSPLTVTAAGSSGVLVNTGGGDTHLTARIAAAIHVRGT